MEPTATKKRKKVKTVQVSSNWMKIAKVYQQSKASGKRKRSEEDPDLSVVSKRAKTMSSALPAIMNEDKSITKYIGLDCEMVGVGQDGEESALAQVVIVNSYGNIIYNKYVIPEETVVDFRTKVSGIRPENLEDEAHPFAEVQKEVSEIIEGRIVVGHSLENDFKALLLSHPFSMTRDTAKYWPLQRKKNKPHSLKWLAKTHLGVEIQTGEHSPEIDARASLLIYNKVKREWENMLKQQRKRKFSRKKGKRDAE